MTNAEYELVKDYTYLEFVEFLNIKYGEVKGPYFNQTKNGTLVINDEIKRTDEGLFIHHVKEDRAVRLSEVEYAKKYPYSYQMATNLVYCDYLEHLFLHTLILESPKGFGRDGHSIGNRVQEDIDRIYEYPHLVKDYEAKARDRIIDDKDVYDTIDLRYISALYGEPKLDEKYQRLKVEGEQRDYIHSLYKKYEDYTYRVNGRGQYIFLKLESVSMNGVSRETTIKYSKVETLKNATHTYTSKNGESFDYRGPGEKVSEQEKTIRLTNKKLESLNQDKDQDIAVLARKIIDFLETKTLVPSWYKLEPIKKEEEKELEELNDNITRYEKAPEIASNYINLLQNGIKKMSIKQEYNETLIKTYTQKSNKISLKIFTLNIYPYMLKNRTYKLINENKKLDEKIRGALNLIDFINNQIPSFAAKLEHCQEEKESIEEKYAPLYEKIIPLAY